LMSDMLVKVKLRGFWEGPPSPSPETTYYEVDWLVPMVPAPGDSICLPDGSASGQEIPIERRILNLDGSIDVWLNLGYWNHQTNEPSENWTREMVEKLWADARAYAEVEFEAIERANRPVMEVRVGEALPRLHALARRAAAIGGDANPDLIRVTVPEGGVLPGQSDQVMVVDGHDRSCVGTIVELQERRVPRPHHAVWVEMDWSTLG
jgi:hypothetical protein